jgi:hypothetical protein
MKVTCTIWEIYDPNEEIENQFCEGCRFTLENGKGLFIASPIYTSKAYAKKRAMSFCEKHGFKITEMKEDYRTNVEFLA